MVSEECGQLHCSGAANDSGLLSQALLGLGAPVLIALLETKMASAHTPTSMGKSTHFTVAGRVVMTFSVLPPTTICKMRKSAAP